MPRSILLALVLTGCFVSKDDVCLELDRDEDGIALGPSDGACPNIVGTSDCDDEDPSVGAPLRYRLDGDDDGYPNPDANLDVVDQCSQPAHYWPADDFIDVANDCNDSDPGTGAASIEAWPDADDDGYGDREKDEELQCQLLDGFATVSGDCNDNDEMVHPDTPEICNDGIDNDCDELQDDEDPGSHSGTATFYLDNDLDGFGSADLSVADLCDAPDGYVPNAADCDDSDGTIHPGADEICNATDDDCDGEVDDEPLDGTPYLVDGDADGYGVVGVEVDTCDGVVGYFEGAWVSVTLESDDCDDSQASVHPDATETCNEIDDDCDATIDDHPPLNEDSVQTYPDLDSDGFGDKDAPFLIQCLAIDYGLREDNKGDCDDTSAAVNPLATETCNDGIDDDCDGLPDDADAAVDGQLSWRVDADEDGWAVNTNPFSACNPGSGYVIQFGPPWDCDDDRQEVNPGETETCNGYDDNCNASSLAATNSLIPIEQDADVAEMVARYADVDGDMYGDSTSVVMRCPNDWTRYDGSSIPALVDYIAADGDCDDADMEVHPNADDACGDGFDADCDSGSDSCDDIDIILQEDPPAGTQWRLGIFSFRLVGAPNATQGPTITDAQLVESWPAKTSGEAQKFSPDPTDRGTFLVGGEGIAWLAILWNDTNNSHTLDAFEEIERQSRTMPLWLSGPLDLWEDSTAGLQTLSFPGGVAHVSPIDKVLVADVPEVESINFDVGLGSLTVNAANRLATATRGELDTTATTQREVNLAWPTASNLSFSLSGTPSLATNRTVYGTTVYSRRLSLITYRDTRPTGAHDGLWQWTSGDEAVSEHTAVARHLSGSGDEEVVIWWRERPSTPEGAVVMAIEDAPPGWQVRAETRSGAEMLHSTPYDADQTIQVNEWFVCAAGSLCPAP